MLPFFATKVLRGKNDLWEKGWFTSEVWALHKSSAYNWSFGKIKWLKKKIKKIFNYKTAFVVVVLGVAGQIHATKTRKDETRRFFGKNQQNCRTWLKNQKSFFRWPSVQAFHLHRLNFYPIWIFVVELPAIPQKNFRHSWSSEFKARFRKCFWKYFDFFSVLRHYTAHLTKEANFWGNPSLYLC